MVDFGGQYTHLIANRIRRLGVFSEIVPSDLSAGDFVRYKGIILSGGPYSVLDADGPTVSPEIFSLGIPILGLCYGHQLIAKILGGKVLRGEKREYGIAELTIINPEPLFANLAEKQQIWMSHGDAVEELPEGFEVCGTTPDCTHAAVGDFTRKFFGLQFHPEVTDTPNGMIMLTNFIDICKCKRSWNAGAFLEEISSNIKKRCARKKVFLLVSGGVDSTVAFTLLNNALGSNRVLGLHIDNGLMRLDESENIIAFLKKQGFGNLHIYDASKEFLSALEGVTDPEEKRTIIGKQFIEAKERAQENFGLNLDEWLLAQGTIYPDTIESAGTEHADKIKTHHNRVDIILELLEKGLVVEPLAQLYKDEVRQLGEKLGIPHDLLWRHPFPGPGLGVRVLCSEGKLDPVDRKTAQSVEAIARPAGFGSCILPVRSVGVQGDSRTYAYPALLYGDCNWSLLETISTQITNTISEINRVVYGVYIQKDPEYSLVEAYLTEERLDKLRAVDHVVTTVLHETGEYEAVWQMPVVLLPVVDREGEECIVLRPIASQEAMTARFFPLSNETLDKIVSGAKNVQGIGDIFFDITNKPPGTIEWE